MKTLSTLFPSAGRFATHLKPWHLGACMGVLTLGTSSLIAQPLSSGQVSVVSTLSSMAGGGSTVPSTVAGPASGASLNAPSGVAVDSSGNFYIADAKNNLVEEVTPAGQITVIAGGGSAAPTTTPAPATAAALNHPTGVAVDAAGNIYIADQANNLVEEIPAGTQNIVIFAGQVSGGTRASTTAEAATTAKLSYPTGVAVSASGTVYIAEEGNSVVDAVTAGQITVVAGGGSTVPSTTPVAAGSAQLSSPAGVAIDAAGNLFIADLSGLVEEVSATTQMLSVIAGGGSTAPSATAEAGTSAQLTEPEGLGVDRAGNVYIADAGSNLIEEWSAATQNIVVVAGGGHTTPSSTGILTTDANIDTPTGVALDAAGNLYISSKGASQIDVAVSGQTALPTTAVGSTSAVQNIQVELMADSPITSIAIVGAADAAPDFIVGTVTGCTVGGDSNPAGTFCSVPVAFHPTYPGVRAGALALYNGITVIGTVGLYGLAQGPFLLQSPGFLAVDAGGGSVVPGAGETFGMTAALSYPTGVAVDTSGNRFVVVGNDGISTIDKVSVTGEVTVVAGGGTTVPGTTPEPATSASIYPFGIALDSAGNLYIGDYGNHLVEKVDATTGQIVVIAGGGDTRPNSTPESLSSASIYPFGIAIDKLGNLFIADKEGQYDSGMIEEIVAGSGQIATIAGPDGNTPGTTPEPATSAGFYNILGVALDDDGNVYIADAGENRIEKITMSTGQIVTIAGSGSNPPSTTPQRGIDVSLNAPSNITVDAGGDVYIADTSSGLIEKLDATGQLVVIAGGGTTVVGHGIPGSPLDAKLDNPTGVAIGGFGVLFITDSGNNLVERLTPSDSASLAFSDTYVGESNATQQTVMLENIGNEPLNVSSVSSATDFPLSDSSSCTTIAAGTSCSLVYGFMPTVSGALNETATVTSNTENVTGAIQTISFTGTGVDVVVPEGSYTITASPATVTVAAGSTGTTTLTLTPTNYTGTVTLTCINLPAYAACRFAQSLSSGFGSGTGTAGITLSGNTPVTVGLTIQTNVAPTTTAMVTERHPLNPILAFCFPGGLIGLVILGRRKKSLMGSMRLLQIGLFILTTGAMAGMIAGCSDSGSSTTPTNPNATPTGTSTVTVLSTAASGTTGLSQSATFTLTVTQ